MPCDSTRTTAVEISAANRAILEAALNHSPEFVGVRKHTDGRISAHHSPTGSDITIEAQSSDATVRSNAYRGNVADAVKNAVNRAYSREVVTRQASRFGWLLKEESPNNFVAQKR